MHHPFRYICFALCGLRYTFSYQLSIYQLSKKKLGKEGNFILRDFSYFIFRWACLIHNGNFYLNNNVEDIVVSPSWISKNVGFMGFSTNRCFPPPPLFWKIFKPSEQIPVYALDCLQQKCASH